MSLELDIIARMIAFEARRAVPIATHQRALIKEEALVVAFVAMAGEDTTIHAVALGRVGGTAEVFCVADPRNRDAQAELLHWLGAALEVEFEACREAGTFPQLIVSSSPAAQHLDTVAEHRRYANAEDYPRVRRFGTLLSFFTDRLPLAGQQALLTATGLLRAHWATGQQPGEDEHLGAMLTWLDPSSGADFFDALMAAETVPMGCKTDPGFDRDVLEPLVSAWGKAKEEGEDVEPMRRDIRRALEPVVLGIYDGIQRAIAHVQAAGMPLLPALVELEKREAGDFESFMGSRDSGYFLSLRDKPRKAAFGLVERENALENWEAALVEGDAMARAGALLGGRVLRATIVDVDDRKVGRKRIIRLEAISDQDVLRLRPLDELSWLGNTSLKVVVESAQREAAQTRVVLCVVAGQQKVGAPFVGAVMEFGSGSADWGSIWRQRKQLKHRLSDQPWTHAESSIPSTPRRRAPIDPLAAVEALR